jgi:hypothetical protein
MKNLSLFLVFSTFLISSCSEDNKEHTIEKWSFWMQTTGETTHRFRFYTKMVWKGTEGKEYLAEHESGDCSYWTYPKGEDPYNYFGKVYLYERNGNPIIIKENYNPPTRQIWLQGHIANDTMFLSNDSITFELQKIESYEDIQ